VGDRVQPAVRSDTLLAACARSNDVTLLSLRVARPFTMGSMQSGELDYHQGSTDYPHST